MSEGKQRRGFAAMSPERQREIARQGGLAAQSKGVAHRFTSEEARAAGQKGGAKLSVNREHMAAIGRKGGLSRGRQVSAEFLERKNTGTEIHQDG